MANGDDGMTRRGFLGRAAALAVSLVGWRGAAGAQGLREVGSGEPWKSGYEVAITFAVGDPRSGSTRRPYVAVFIEDSQGKPVRTVVLWALREVSWLRQMKHWFRGETARQAEEGGNLVSTLSSATRRPGEYTVVWDGRNNAGELVEQGEYFVCVETVREKAGNYLVRERFSFGDEPFTAKAPDFASIQNVTIEYRAKS